MGREMNRNMRYSMDEQRRMSEPDDGTDLIMIALGVLFVLALIVGGLGLVDNWFGWGLKDWFLGLLTNK